MRCLGRWCVTLALALPACDSAEDFAGEVAGDGEDGPGNDERRDPARAIEAVHALAGALQAEAHRSATIAAEAVFLASQLADAGQVVTTGTLVQDASGFTWAPRPADRMVVAFGDDTTIDLWIRDMAGDSTSATAFLEGEHRFAWRVRVPDRLDLAFASARRGGAITSSADGTFVHEDVEYAVAIEVEGTCAFESDSTGAHFRDEHRTTGSITADGFDLDLDETWHDELVTSRGESAQATRRTVSSSLRWRDDVYDWVDVVTQTSFRNAKPSSVDTAWTTDGEILRNGSTWGTYRLGPTQILGFVTIVVDIPQRPLELERHATD